MFVSVAKNKERDDEKVLEEIPASVLPERYVKRWDWLLFRLPLQT